MDALRVGGPAVRALQTHFLPSGSSNFSTVQVNLARRALSGHVLPRSLRHRPQQRKCLTICEHGNSKPRSAAAGRKSAEGHREDDFPRKKEQSLWKGCIPMETKSRSMGLFLRGAVLVVGFGLVRFCKPAFAENIAVPPAAVSATLDSKGDVESTQELDDSVGANGATAIHDQSSGSEEKGAEGFEPPFGEGSDLTSDPAEILLRSYLQMHPGDKKALQALLFKRLKKGEVNAALPVLQKLIELEPDNIEWKYIKAQADEYSGDLLQARRGFEEILESKPLSARAWQGLAVIMHKTGEDEEALELLIDAVKKAAEAGQSQEALNLKMLLGQLHTMQGNLEKAMELYKTVVEEDPKDYRPYLCQGLVYSIIGEDAEAEKYFRRYRKLCPKDFPQRGFLDELMLKAKTEAQKLGKRNKEEAEMKKKGQKVPKIMRQPVASGGVSFKDDQNARS